MSTDRQVRKVIRAKPTVEGAGVHLKVVSTEEEPVRFLLISGKPIGEPIAWYGPIVMNTRAELRVAFDEYGSGTFIKRRRT